MIQLNAILSGLKISLPIICITCTLLILPKNSHALEWKDLWQTSDQQAQKAFQQQQYEQAAGQFEQPEWKAAAQYKAGQYEQVMDTLKDIHTSEGLYNQGNAYVKQGQLQEALESYQKSLEIDPENTDAKYNKELIEKELEKQKQQQDQQQDQGDSGDQDQQDNNDSKNKDGEQGDQSEAGKDQKESESQGENQQDADKNDSEAKPEQAENQQQESDESTKDAESAKPSKEETGEDDAEASAVDQSNTPKDESEQASEQWLKRIPDDPAGLLKRKFEYQYKQRTKGSRNQQENW